MKECAENVQKIIRKLGKNLQKNLSNTFHVRGKRRELVETISSYRVIPSLEKHLKLVRKKGGD